MLIKIAVIVGGVVLMAGAALAGTLTSLGSSSDNPRIATVQPAASTQQQEDRGREREQRGRENEREQRGRENEPGEDLRGPCDEAEHANDPRCTGTVTGEDDHRGRDGADADRGHDRRGHDDGGHSGHGGGGDD